MNPATWLMCLAFVAVLLGIILDFADKRKWIWYGLIVINAALILYFGFQAQNQQEAYNNDRINFQQQLASKSDEIATLAKETTFLSTGGDSFCYLGFLFGTDAPNTPVLAVVHEGKYPLQNVHVVITDMERFKATFPNIPKGRENARPATAKELDEIDDMNFLFEVPFLGPPGTTLRLRPRWKLPERDQVTYSINIYTQFQTFHQNMKLRKVDGRWTIAFRVVKPVPDKEPLLLREEIPRNFPRDQSGKVKWSDF